MQMKNIPLTHGYFTIVDDEMYPILSKYKWSMYRNVGGTVYAQCTKWKIKYGIRLIRMHHVIAGFPLNGLITDHIDGNGLNNTRANLRITTRRMNVINIKRKTTLLGVHKRKRHKKWGARITIDGKRKWLGSFPTPQSAQKAYINELKKNGESIEDILMRTQIAEGK